MGCCANDHCSSDNRQPDGRYRRALWVALVLNGGIFLTEIVAGLGAGSAAAEVMGLVGVLALLVNGGVAFLLYRYRGGDSNARSVWICSRNDALGNVAVMLAALGVFGTGTGSRGCIVPSGQGG